MRSGTHRAAKQAWLMSGTAVLAAGAVGLGGAAIMRAAGVVPWRIDVTVPVVGRHEVPAVEAGGAFIAAAVAVCIILVWYAVAHAARQKRWRDNGPAVLHGDTAARATHSCGAAQVQLARVEHDVRTNARDIEMIRAHMRDVSGLISGAYEDAGRPPPEMAPLEEPDTWWVPRVIKGGAGLDEAG